MDTSVLVAISNKRDMHHYKGRKLLRSILREKPRSRIYVSDYIIDESISVVLARTKAKPDMLRRKIIGRIDYMVYHSRFFRVIHVDEISLSSALSYLRKEKFPLVSLTDWTVAVMMKNLSITEILSLDKDFDEISKLTDFSFIKRIGQL